MRSSSTPSAEYRSGRAGSRSLGECSESPDASGAAARSLSATRNARMGVRKAIPTDTGSSDSAGSRSPERQPRWRAWSALEAVPRPVRDAQAERDVISGSVVARHDTCRRPSDVVVGEQEFALRAIEVATWDALGGIGVLDGAVVIGVYPAASSMASLGCDNSRRARARRSPVQTYDGASSAACRRTGASQADERKNYVGGHRCVEFPVGGSWDVVRRRWAQCRSGQFLLAIDTGSWSSIRRQPLP